MKIQYFPSDLSHKLGIGEIIEMHVEQIPDHITKTLVPVLRIECKDVDKDEYKTVRVQAQTKAKPKDKTRVIPKVKQKPGNPLNFEKLMSGPDFNR